MTTQSILWRRLDLPGHEWARLFERDSSWCLDGTALFVHRRQPCRLDYQVICDSQWQTKSGKVTGWIGDQAVAIEVTVDQARRWWINGTQYPEVAGCIDLDLNFSPSTNLLPVRRLNLELGQEAPVRAAWLRFPELTLEPLEQLYRRVSAGNYHYESAGGSFVAELTVDAAGFVTRYPGLWEAVV